MMGSRDPQKQLWSYHVNLDKRVRSKRGAEGRFRWLGGCEVLRKQGNIVGRPDGHHENDAALVPADVRSERDNPIV
jgi:hypothetical protein